MRPSVESLMAQYGANVYLAAFNVCKDPRDAEDAAQETFLAYWNSQKDFESPQHLRAWLFRVAINKAKNQRRRFSRQNTVPLEDYLAALPFPDEGASDLLEAVLALPEKYRTVVHLFYYEDYSAQEIGRILGITPGNVRVRLNRGRALLKERLKEAWNDDRS